MNICQNCGLSSENLYKSNADDFKFNNDGIKTGNLYVCLKCRTQFDSRAEKLKEIIESNSHKKRLIVAGPGTGKTHAFKRVVESISSDKNIIIFTLIINLSEDLKREFSDHKYQNVKVGTFHGYCKDLLYNSLGCQDVYYPDLSILIESDALLLEMELTKNDFRESFADLDTEGMAHQFFLARSKYYAATGYEDSVYKVYDFFLHNRTKVPTYELVIADEYQDFNKLESSLINILGERSPVLIAGDDDQALYGFRKASTDYIRDLNDQPAFKKFNLPYSSRCTNVLVDTVNKLVEKVKRVNLLEGRIEPKEYISYWPDKFIYDKKYPQIELANCSAVNTAMLYIKDRIEAITADEKLDGSENDIQFLVIGAESQHRLTALATYLKSILNNDIYKIESKKEDEEKVDLEFGYHLIYRNVDSNLGWRIISFNDPPENIVEIIRTSYIDGTSFYSLLPHEYIEKYLAKIQSYFKDDHDKSMEEVALKSDEKKITVKLTNCLGSKGLSALHVIIMEFHNGVIPQDKTGHVITNEDVCKCIVALTRAKRSCSLVIFKEFDINLQRSVQRPSKFIKLIPENNINEVSFKRSNGKLVKV